MLPDALLTCHVYTQFICLYRQLLTEAIMDEGRDSQDAGKLLLLLSYSSKCAELKNFGFREHSGRFQN